MRKYRYSVGGYVLLQFPKDVFGITRTYGEEALFTVINFSDSEISIQHEYKLKTCSAVVEIGDAVRCLPDSFVIPALSGSVLKIEKK